MGPTTVADHIVPTIADAADEAGRPAPRVVDSVPVSVTDRPDEVRSFISEILAGYDTLPSYRGDIVNRSGFSEGERTPDPVLLLRGYERAALTLNFIRARTRALFTAINRA